MLQNILKTALLGTEKSFPEKDDFPKFLHPTYDKIMSSDLTIEAKYLRLATYVLQIDATTTPLLKNTTTTIHPPAEDFVYVGKKTNQFLSNALTKNDILMVKYIIQLTAKQQKIVSPYNIPALLNMAEKHLEWRAMLLQCCGNRAKWLVQYKATWEKLFDEEANIEKLIKKQQKATKSPLENILRELSRADKYHYLKSIKNDAEFYAYLQILMTDEFMRFPADFSVEIWSQLQRKQQFQAAVFYQNLALHLHSTLKMELMEQTNTSYQQTIGIMPNMARLMLETIMDRDIIDNE